MFKILLMIAFFHCLSWTHSAEAKEERTYTFVTEEWKDFTNKDGSGIYFELIKSVFANEGIKVKFQIMPWKRARLTVEKRQQDGIIGVYEGEDKLFTYPKLNIDRDVVYVVFKKGKGWKNPTESLAGKKVSWRRGYGFETQINSKFTLKEVDTVDQGLKMLAAGRIDYLVDYIKDIEVSAKKHSIDLKDFTIVNDFAGNKIFIAFSRDESGRNLAKIWDRGLTKILKGDRTEIDKAYSKVSGRGFPVTLKESHGH